MNAAKTTATGFQNWLDLHVHPHTRRAARLLFAAIGAILGLSFGSRIMARLLRAGTEAGALDDVAQFLSVDGERNLPATASGILFAATAALCARCATRSVGRARWAWAFFGVTTVAMAGDELFEIHERLLKSVGEALGFEEGGLVYFVWVIPGAMLAVGLVVAAAWLTRPLARWQRLGTLAAAGVFFSGALGVETITGLLFDEGGSSLLYVVLQIVEEGLEFSGEALMFLTAFESLRRLTVRVAPQAPVIRPERVSA